jgi:hypothetical protein
MTYRECPWCKGCMSTGRGMFSKVKNHKCPFCKVYSPGYKFREVEKVMWSGNKLVAINDGDRQQRKKKIVKRCNTSY